MRRKLLLSLLNFIKICCYATLGLMTYFNFIEPSGVAELLQVNNPSENGIKLVAIIIPEYMVWLTLLTITLEVLTNSLELPDKIK